MGIREKSVKIYCCYEKDWMGFKITKKNPYSFHHIIKSCDGGKTTINNFAILTKSSHRYLNLLERLYPNIYNELNDVFLELISSNAPPTKKYYEKIDKILKKVPEFKF